MVWRSEWPWLKSWLCHLSNWFFWQVSSVLQSMSVRGWCHLLQRAVATITNAKDLAQCLHMGLYLWQITPQLGITYLFSISSTLALLVMLLRRNKTPIWSRLYFLFALLSPFETVTKGKMAKRFWTKRMRQWRRVSRIHKLDTLF